MDGVSQQRRGETLELWNGICCALVPRGIILPGCHTAHHEDAADASLLGPDIPMEICELGSSLVNVA